jgi:hypothetical protein
MHIKVWNFTAHSVLTVDNYTLYISLLKQILEKTEMAIKNGQYRETGNIGHKNTGRRQTKQITQKTKKLTNESMHRQNK